MSDSCPTGRDNYLVLPPVIQEQFTLPLSVSTAAYAVIYSGAITCTTALRPTCHPFCRTAPGCIQEDNACASHLPAALCTLGSSLLFPINALINTID